MKWTYDGALIHLFEFFEGDKKEVDSFTRLFFAWYRLEKDLMVFLDSITAVEPDRMEMTILAEPKDFSERFTEGTERITLLLNKFIKEHERFSLFMNGCKSIEEVVDRVDKTAESLETNYDGMSGS